MACTIPLIGIGYTIYKNNRKIALTVRFVMHQNEKVKSLHRYIEFSEIKHVKSERRYGKYFF